MNKALIICALVASAYGQTCTKYEGSDIGLPDSGQVSGRQEWECCGICGSTPGCQAYAWNSFEGGTCWLKAGTGPIVSNPGVTVGVIGGGGGGDFP